MVGEGTHASQMRRVMFYPTTATDEIIEEMVKRGMVREEITSDRGRLLNRIG